MTKLEELERAFDNLPEEEYCRFRSWFMKKDWERWDRQNCGRFESGQA
jgi:hypothetical protein